MAEGGDEGSGVGDMKASKGSAVVKRSCFSVEAKGMVSL